MKQDPRSAAKTAPESTSPVEAGDVYELFVAELKARRERLNHLLRLVTLEVNRSIRETPAATPRGRCRRPAGPG